MKDEAEIVLRGFPPVSDDTVEKLDRGYRKAVRRLPGVYAFLGGVATGRVEATPTQLKAAELFLRAFDPRLAAVLEAGKKGGARDAALEKSSRRLGDAPEDLLRAARRLGLDPSAILAEVVSAEEEEGEPETKGAPVRVRDEGLPGMAEG